MPEPSEVEIPLPDDQQPADAETAPEPENDVVSPAQGNALVSEIDPAAEAPGGIE